MFLTNNLLFIHIPKSAGSSVVKVLEEEPEKINKFFRDNGINQDLPLTNNRKIPSHENAMYREYYNSYTKNIIREKYEDDLNIYNYDF